MSKPVEFSQFYRCLNAVKEGDSEKQIELFKMIDSYKLPQDCPSPLHELGQIFIHIGIMELYKYAGTEDIRKIGLMQKSEWDELEKKQKAQLPPHLANAMINYAKENQLSTKISSKWSTAKREIDNNIMTMARYIVEGIIDAID